ncbi:uncharacterized protein [Euphorbia lathyris]|uniref:uncharacterized protein n=1 Tax=Euphorbia lathyris TaxID=212925 RepID=UPI0033142B08
MDHRRFLPIDHKWRENKSFNGIVERRSPPKKLSGVEILAQVKDLEGMKFGKRVKLPKRDDNWKKKSIFFELPYWSTLLLRHNLDVMHIEKNVCDNILGTLLDIEGKSKDNIKARHDFKRVKIMKHLAPKLMNGKWHIPPAPYTLSRTQKEKVCKFLECIKVPDGYSSNISKCINLDKRKIWGLKTHDCHVLMEQLLPLAIWGVSLPKVYEVIVKMSTFFRDLCSKILKVKDLDTLERQISITLCEMEKIFLPSFFDVMVHLCVHLATEAKLGGPVQYRWMYPIERLLRKLKCYVRNKSRPEGSIAEGYIIEECMLFCSKYLHDIETRFNQPDRNTDEEDNDYQGLSIFAPIGIPLGKAKLRSLTKEELTQVREYVLKNCDEAQEYLNEYEDGTFDKNLVDWFRDRVMDLLGEGHDDQVVKDLRTFALGPLEGVKCFNGYVGNGFRFHTKETERKRVNQNSGVMVKGIVGAREDDYFGILTDIIEA